MTPFRLLARMRRTQVRECLGALVLLGLLTQAPIPTGFMPDGTGLAFLKLCSGVTTDADDRSHGWGGHGTAAVCPFASGAPAGAAPAMTAGVVAPISSTQFLSPIFAAALPTGLSGPVRAQSPRAPPARCS